MINAEGLIDLAQDVKGSFARQLREAADALHDAAEALDPTGPTDIDTDLADAECAYRNGYRDGKREAAPSTEALSAEFKRGWDAGQDDMARLGHARFAPNPPASMRRTVPVSCDCGED